MDLPRSADPLAKTEHSNGVELFPRRFKLSVSAASQRMSLPEPCDGSQTVQQIGFNKPPQKASGSGLRDYSVPSADQKSLVILHFSSSIFLLAEYALWLEYFCFMIWPSKPYDHVGPCPSKLFLVPLIWLLGFPFAQAGDVMMI